MAQPVAKAAKDQKNFALHRTVCCFCYRLICRLSGQQNVDRRHHGHQPHVDSSDHPRSQAKTPHSDVSYTYIRLRISPLSPLQGRYRGLRPPDGQCVLKKAVTLGYFPVPIHRVSKACFWNDQYLRLILLRSVSYTCS